VRRHDPRTSLYDVLEAGADIALFLDGRSPQDYAADPMLRAAVERKFEIIGEALTRATAVAPELERSIPSVRQAIGLRNAIAHGYDEIIDRLVFSTARDDLPELLADVRTALDGMSLK